MFGGILYIDALEDAAEREAIAERRLRTQVIRQQLRIQRRQIRDVSNPFNFDEEYFRKLYRLTPHLTVMLIDVLHNHITAQGFPRIPVYMQVLLSLRLFGNGCFQKALMNDYNHPVGQRTFSRCLNRVVNALNIISNDWIKFPSNTIERQQTSESFMGINRIPGILGLMDCVVIKIVRPTENEEAYFHHKHSHAFNVQVVCNADYVIVSMRICPGSNNDRFIWRHSIIRQHMLYLQNNADIVNEEGPYYFLADSGYTPSKIILTPVVNAPENSPAARYTENHVQTRCRVEQCFGVFENRFMAMNRKRVLYYKPAKAAKIITACAVLHNFIRLGGVMPEVAEAEPNLGNLEMVDFQENFALGIAERNRLIDLYYT